LTHALVIAGYQDFNTTILSDPVNSRFLLFWIHFHVLSIPIMLMYFSRFNFIWKSLVIFMLYAIYYISYKLNLIWIKEGWFLPVSTANIWEMYLSLYILDRLYGKTKTG
jgi:hypothetical protein